MPADTIDRPMSAVSTWYSGASRSTRLLAEEIRRAGRWPRIVAVVLLLAAGLLVLPRGGPGAILVTVGSVVIVALVAWAVAAPADRPWVLAIAVLAILSRDALVGAIDDVLLAHGAQWFAPDEHIYIGRALAIWQHWLHPAAPFDNTDPYNSSWYVHAMARTYLVFGDDLVVVKLFNTLLAVVAGLLGYRAMRNFGMPGARWALPLVLAFPSIVLWSSLTLKDAWVCFFLITSLWAASEFVRSRNYIWLPIAILVLVPIETVRLYMLVTGALALLGVPFAMTRWRDRLLSGAALLVGIYVFFGIIQPFADLGSNLFWIPIYVRGSGAQGARTSFVEPFPVIQGAPGQQFQVGVASGATADPGVTPRVIVVQPGTQLVIVSPTPTPASGSSAAAGAASPTGASPTAAGPTPAIVRPGDIVVIATAAPSAVSLAPVPSPSPTLASPTPTPALVVLEPGAKNTVGVAGTVDPEQSSIQGSLSANVRHLPTGIAYTLFAPFPWTPARTLEQLATIPEMLIWYVCLLLALLGFLVLLRRRDLRYAPGVAMIIGLILVLSLIEANVGTLVRSRAMLIPYVLLLSAVGFETLRRRYPRLIPVGSRE